MTTKNDEKRERYAILKAQLKKALSQDFWFEACMIEYAIIEDRTSSILAHARVCQDAYGAGHKLGNKLNSIELQIGKKHPVIAPKVDPVLIKELRDWKERRNDLVHRACTLYNAEQAKNVAVEGNHLVNRLINDCAKVTRLANKKHEE